MKETLKHLLRSYKQIILYGIIGCLCAGLDFLFFTFLKDTPFTNNLSAYLNDLSWANYLNDLFGINLFKPYLLANIFSIHVGIFTSFFLNRQFTFQVKNKTALRFLSFYVIGITGLLISSGLLVLFIEKMQINELVSKAITVIVVALIQFLLNKYISFKHGKQ